MGQKRRATRRANGRTPRPPPDKIRPSVSDAAKDLARDLRERFARLARLGDALEEVDAALGVVLRHRDVQATTHLKNLAFRRGRDAEEADEVAAREFGAQAAQAAAEAWRLARFAIGLVALTGVSADDNQARLVVAGELRRQFGLSESEAEQAMGYSNLRVPRQREEKRVREMVARAADKPPRP